jgi:CDP-glycerol glycerophosphotransferase (TagB/SpsB family)
VLETLLSLAGPGRWKWLVNMHPKMPRDIVEQYRAAQNKYFQLVETDDVIPLLATADVMLCDTSSILSEFLTQLKPVVTFNTARPARHLIDVQSVDEIGPALERARQRPADLMERIRHYADRTHPYRDGRSSERTLDAIDELAAVGAARLKRKPLNLYRHWKMRRLLDYRK